MDNKYKRHGAFSWCELLTTDVPEARRFYSKLFGWTLKWFLATHKEDRTPEEIKKRAEALYKGNA